MKRAVPLLGVVILIGLLTVVNRGINKTARPDVDDDDAPAPQATQTKPASPADAAAKPSADLPAEITVGDPARAKFKITVGWVYDEANQADPQALAAALQAVQTAAQNSGGTASAEIFDLDVPPGGQSPHPESAPGLGVAVNGQPVTTANPGEPGATAADLAGALQGRLSGR